MNGAEFCEGTHLEYVGEGNRGAAEDYFVLRSDAAVRIEEDRPG